MTTPLEEIVSGLREAAEKATPGPWVHSRFGTQVLTGDSWSTVCVFWERTGDKFKEHQFASWEDGRTAQSLEANSAYIAAANPQALLSVLDAFQTQAARIAELTAKLSTADALVTCCCGSPVDSHGMGDGHSPVDQYHYAYYQMEVLVETAERDLAAAVEERDALKAEAIKALTPFAEASASYDPPEGDDNHMTWAHDFPIGALRRAAVALAKLKGSAK